jgi:RNA recognition motif-containing protein
MDINDEEYDYDFDESLNNNQNNNNNMINNNIIQNTSSFQQRVGMNNQNKMIPNYIHEKLILYISDLPYNTTETDIKYFFKRYADKISHITINQKYHNENDTRPLSGKVIFADHETANQARLEMNLRKLKGHAIRLMWEERDNSIRYNSTTNLFVKGIPFNVQPREVYEYFMKFGDISSAKLKENNEGNHLGYGYITYYSPESAEKAIKNTNGKKVWGGVPLQVDYFKKKNERLSTAGPEVFKLYITNFPGDFTENNIIELTKEFGAIVSCTIKTEKIGRRYALVCYETEEAVNKAKESLENKNIHGYFLFCRILNDKNYPNEMQMNRNKINNNKAFFPRHKPGFINSDNNMCNLYIKEIPYTIKEKEFREIFEKYGKIVSAKLETYNLITNIGDKTVSTPTSKGYGYVCYEDQEVARKVKNGLNGQYLPGYEHWKNPLIIEYFLSKSQKEMTNLNYGNNNFYNYNYNYMTPMQPNYLNNNDKQFVSLSSFDYNKYNSLNDETKKDYLGNIIYEQVYNSPLIENRPERDKVIAKITGMILGIENNEEIIRICTDIDALNKNIAEALNLLNNSNYDFNS